MYRTQQRKDLSQWLIHFIHDSTTQHLPKDITPADIPDLIVECEPEDYFDSDDQNESKVNLLNEYQKILEAYHKRYPFPKAPDEEDNFLTELQNFYCLLDTTLNKKTDYYCQSIGSEKINIYDTSTAFENLKKIIRTGFIKSTWSFRNGKPTVYGLKSTVCFTEMPLYALLQYVKTRSDNKNASPYAVIFLKSELFRAKVRPVIYGLSGEHKETSNNNSTIRCLDESCGIGLDEQYRYVEFNLTSKRRPIDWTHEREWRWGDLDGYGVSADIPGFPLFPLEEEDYNFSQIIFLVNTNKEAEEIIDLLRNIYDAGYNDFYEVDVNIVKNCQVISLEDIHDDILKNEYLTMDEIPTHKFSSLTFTNAETNDINKIETALKNAGDIYTKTNQGYINRYKDTLPAGFGHVATKEANTPLTRYLIENEKVYTDSNGNYILKNCGESFFQNVEINYISALQASIYLTKELGQKFYPIRQLN